MRNVALLAALAALIVLAVFGVFSTVWLVIPALLAAAYIGHALNRAAPAGGADARVAARSRFTVGGTTDADAASDDIAGPLVRSETDARREMTDSLRVVCDSAGARAMLIWRVDPAADSIRAIAAHGRALPPARPLRGDPLAWVAKEGTPMRLDPSPTWAGDNTRVAAIRLWQREKRGWLVTLEFDTDAALDLSRLDAVAAPLRLLVDLQERSSDTVADRRRLHQLLDILHRIPVATELEPAANDLIDACMQLAGATGGTVGMWDDDSGRIVAVRGDDGGPVAGTPFKSPSSELALAVRAGEPLIRTDNTWKPGATQMASTSDRWDARPRAFAAIPLATGSGITAVLGLWTTASGSLDAGGLDLIRTVAPYAALHLRHAGEFGRMKETAETDGLTGLRNRRAFDAALLLESSRFERYARPLSLLMIDLDHFKAVNDTYGHEAGDDVLRKVAAIVRSCVRDVDTAARFGGEELAVLLPETPIAAAREVAERIRLTIAGQSFDRPEGTLRATVSIGLAAVPETVDVPGSLLGKADEALYAAKTGGRNRVVAGSSAPG